MSENILAHISETVRWDLCKNIPNSTSSVKIHNESFEQVQEKHVLTHFWSNLPILEALTILLEYLVLSQ